jgi:PAS domain-containing protein
MYKMFFDRLPVLAILADETSTIIDVNDAWTETLGWDKNELIGKPFLDFVHPDDRTKTLDAMDVMYMQPMTNFKNRYKCKKISVKNANAMLPGGYVELEWESSTWGGERKLTAATAKLNTCARSEDYSAFVKGEHVGHKK